MVIYNQLKTVFLMSSLMAFFMLIGFIIGNKSGLIFAFVFAMIFNFGSFWFSDKIVLKMYKAKEVATSDKLYLMVKELAQRAQLPMPKVYIVNNHTPNAFATGRDYNHSAVAVTTGLLHLMDDNEIKGVLAHELSHIKHRDTLIQTFTIAIASAISMIATMLQWAMIFGMGSDEDNGMAGFAGTLLIIILAPIVATMIQMAISRNREYMADEGSAKIMHNPEYLIKALRKLEAGVQKHPFTDNTKAQTASMFIVNPFRRGKLAKLFSTHPSTEDRINHLMKVKF